jgi:hypothetical protein
VRTAIWDPPHRSLRARTGSFPCVDVRWARYHYSSSFPLPAYGAGGTPAHARSSDQLIASLAESTYRTSWGDKGHRTLTFPLYPPRRLATREGGEGEWSRREETPKSTAPRPSVLRPTSSARPKKGGGGRAAWNSSLAPL